MSRYNSRLRGLQRLLLIHRDGNKCSLCPVRGLPTREDGTYDLELVRSVRAGAVKEFEGQKPLDVHHLDGNETHNTPKNIRLACHSCNMKEIHRNNLRTKNDSGHVNVRVRVKTNSGRSGAQEARSFESTDTIRKASTMRPLFRAYCVRRLIDGQPEVEDICNSFPKFVENEFGLIGWGSDRTCMRYLSYETSSEGDMFIETTPSGLQILKFRDSKDYEQLKNYQLPSLDDLRGSEGEGDKDK